MAFDPCFPYLFWTYKTLTPISLSGFFPFSFSEFLIPILSQLIDSSFLPIKKKKYNIYIKYTFVPLPPLSLFSFSFFHYNLCHFLFFFSAPIVLSWTIPRKRGNLASVAIDKKSRWVIYFWEVFFEMTLSSSPLFNMTQIIPKFYLEEKKDSKLSILSYCNRGKECGRGTMRCFKCLDNDN